MILTEIKGIEQHYQCGHIVTFSTPLPEYSKTAKRYMAMAPDNIYRFADFSHKLCAVCETNNHFQETKAS